MSLGLCWPFLGNSFLILRILSLLVASPQVQGTPRAPSNRKVAEYSSQHDEHLDLVTGRADTSRQGASVRVQVCIVELTMLAAESRSCQ